MTDLRTCMSFADILSVVSDGKSTRLEAVVLPHDPALQQRYALILAGPGAQHILSMITEALDEYFTRGLAAQPQVSESHGPDSSAARPD